jgi:hypothetical protein
MIVTFPLWREKHMVPRMTISVSEDKSKTTVEFLPASGASGSLELTADQLLRMIQALGDAHKEMVFEQPIPALEGQNIGAIFNTRWFVDPALLGEAASISFYHTAFGPVGFLVPIDQVETMVGLLSNQVELAKAVRSKPN